MTAESMQEVSQAFNNPMRVVPTGAGWLVTFTLFRQESVSDVEFARDAEMIESDLQALKRVVEALSAGQPYAARLRTAGFRGL